MSDTKAVLRKLLSDHVGESNAVTQKELATATGVNTSTLRSEIRRLREERNIPIGNLRDGYYIIGDREELQNFIGHKNEEIQSKRKTIEDTLEAFEEFDPDDVAVDPKPEPEDDEPEVKEKSYPCAKCGDDVPRSESKWPKDGPYEDEVVCKSCYGGLVRAGQA